MLANAHAVHVDQQRLLFDLGISRREGAGAQTALFFIIKQDERGLFALLFAGLRGVLPEVAANKMLFTLFDALTLFLPVVERVQLVGCKHDFDIGHGVLCAALAFYQNRGSDPFDADATNRNISSVCRRLDIGKNH